LSVKFSKAWIRGFSCAGVFVLVIGGLIYLAIQVGRSRSGGSVYIHQTDPEIEAAIARARASVGGFIKLLESPPPNARHFAVRARLTKGSEAEFVWVNSLSYEKGIFHGKVAESPALVTTIQKGDPIDVPSSQIADWIIEYRDADGAVRYEGDEINKVLLSRQNGHTLRYPSRQSGKPDPRTA
jgi:uncharacterized protein YegJ (DUF2314 family)